MGGLACLDIREYLLPLYQKQTILVNLEKTLSSNPLPSRVFGTLSKFGCQYDSVAKLKPRSDEALSY